MSDPLDDKLRAVLTGVRNEYDVSDDVIAQIRQAFTDAGWREPWDGATRVRSFEMNKGRVYMLGQEWFNRFIKEADHEPVSWPDNATNEYITAVVGIVYMEAARRAAGIPVNETKENT